MSRDVRLERYYPHAPAKVWRVLTKPEMVARWLAPGDFRAARGHTFDLRIAPAPGFDGRVRCEVLEVQPPLRLRLSWRGGPVDTEVHFELEPEGSGTRLRLVHSGFGTARSAALPAIAAAWADRLSGLGAELGGSGPVVGTLGVAGLAALALVATVLGVWTFGGSDGPAPDDPRARTGPPALRPTPTSIRGRVPDPAARDPGDPRADAPPPVDGTPEAPTPAGTPTDPTAEVPGPRGLPPTVRQLAAAPATPEGRLRMVGELPTTLHPLYGATPADRHAATLVFDPLFVQWDSGVWVTRLVRRWSVDGDRVSLTLVSDIRWHDGQPLVADDVCHTVRALTDPSLPVAASLEAARDALRACTVTGPLEVSIVLNGSRSEPREVLEWSVLPAHLPRSGLLPDGEVARRPVGTGPLSARLDRRELALSAVPNAHHQPRIERVVVAPVADPRAQLSTIASGFAELLTDLAPTLADEVRSPLQAQRVDGGQALVAQLRSTGVLGDPGAREAVALALDREVLFGGGQNLTVSGPFEPGGLPASPPGPDAERARALLAGLGGGPDLRIGVHEALARVSPDVATRVADALGAVGFSITAAPIAGADWPARVSGTAFDLVLGPVPSRPGARQDLAAVVGEAGAYNMLGAASSPVLDRAVEAYSAAGPPDRGEAERAVLEGLAAQGTTLWLSRPPRVVVARDGLVGVQWDAWFGPVAFDRWTLAP